MKVRRIDFSPDEWLGGTVALDNAERGLYITACALIYAHNGPIDRELLRAACRDHGHAFNRQLKVLIDRGKLLQTDGQISNKRAINELQNAHKRSIKLSQSGTLGNEIKQLKHARRVSLANANHQPSTINKRPNGLSNTVRDAKASLTPSTRCAEDEFAEFYQAYPRHIGKGAALKAFIRARQSVDQQTLLTAVTRYAEQRAGEDPRYTPHPATWLNQQRWADDDLNPQGGTDHDDAARQAAIEEALRELHERQIRDDD